MNKIVLILVLLITFSCKDNDLSSQSIEVKTPEWLSASVDPDSSLGKDKDHFFNRLSGDVFVKENGSWSLISNIKGTKGDTGNDGINGTDGLDGKSTKWISGIADPASIVGNDGDYFYNTTNGNVFLKESGVWSLNSNIKGIQGAQGLKGDKGDQGNQGIQGLQGDKGDKGDKGDQGDQGIQGIQGLKGDKGDQGDQGIQGIQGVQGLKGDKGDQGDQGIQGIQGVQGLKGDKGDQGDQGIQGIQGIQGVQGLKGDQGDQGIQGIQGLKGDKGDQGDQGIQGLKGDKGDNGLSTIANKEVQLTNPNDKEILIFDINQNKWIAKTLDISSESTGSITTSRVTGLDAIIQSINNSISSILTSISDLIANKADKTYVDSQDSSTLASAQTDATTKATQSLNDSKSYTDTQVAPKADKTYVDSQDASNLASAQSDATAKSTQALNDSKSYTDAQVAPKADKTYVDSQDASTLTSAQTDATTKATQSLNDSKSYTDTQVAPKADKTYVDSQDNATLTSAQTDATTKAIQSLNDSKSYTDTQVASKADKAYVDSQDSTKLNLSGGKLTGDLQLNSKTTASESTGFALVDSAKIWFNSTINKLKFWDGSTAQELATSTDLTLKADQTSVTSSLLNKANTADLGSLAYKSSITNVDINGTINDAKIAGMSSSKLIGTISDSQIAGVSGSKVSGVIGNNIGDSLVSSSLSGWIDGVAKTIGSSINRVAQLFATALDVSGDATIGGTLTSNNIIATSSLKVGANDVLTNQSSLDATKLINTVSTSSGVASAGKIPALNSNGKIDDSMINSINATSIVDSTGRFIDTTIGTNTLSSNFAINIGSGKSFVLNGTTASNGLKVKSATVSDDFSPAASIDVGGAIVSRTFEITSTTITSIDFSKGNTVLLSSPTGSTNQTIDLQGLVDGGSYSIIVKGDATARTFTFTANSPIATKTGTTYSTGTVKPNPAFAATTASKDTIYNIMVARNVVYITWMSDF